MADLARMRYMLLNGTDFDFHTAAMYHLTTHDPTQNNRTDAELIGSLKAWISSAPGVFFGTGLGMPCEGLDILRETMLQEETDIFDDAVALCDGMRVNDVTFDRLTRGSATLATAASTPQSKKVSAQSAIEFAAYDVITEAGFEDEEDARKLVQTFMASNKSSKLVFKHHQFSRSRTSACCVLVNTRTGARRLCITPYMTSKEASLVFIAIRLRNFLRAGMVDRAHHKARTVLGYAARTSLMSVRKIVESARAICNTYTLDRQRLEFINDKGQKQFDIYDRTPAVVVAFSKVFSHGAVDINHVNSRTRSDMEIPGNLTEWESFYLDADLDVSGQLRCAASCLADARATRDSKKDGKGMNKDQGLTYFARDKKAVKRNTAACINRIEEVSALIRSRGGDMCEHPLFVSWSGNVDNDMILAACAMTGSPVGVDTGVGSFIVGTKGESVSPSEDMAAMVCLVPHAARRGVLRMPMVTYKDSTSMRVRVEQFCTAIGQPGSVSDVVVIMGGDTTREASEADVTLCNNAIYSQLYRGGSRPYYFTCDLLFPPICVTHQMHMSEELLCGETTGELSCLTCKNFQACINCVSLLLEQEECHLVKVRSSYAHNMHLTLERVHDMSDDERLEHTMATLDAMLAANRARNAPWHGEFKPSTGVTRASHAEYGRIAASIIQESYEMMSQTADMEFDVGTIVDSVVAK
uniref:Uncharacterized protein n=1 Tax=Erysiphe necator associated polymycovirus 2 TaxID=2742556 RepID=A0A8E3YWF6_9VIRU|nr:hypothetical protein [Erysiphe necator associated polymycovirus 2]